MKFNTLDKIEESNRIEGIDRPVRGDEIVEFTRFIALERVVVADLIKFVSVYQPGARLRDQPGLDVIVGKHTPPPGSSVIPYKLDDILLKANMDQCSPWQLHREYEDLHPFTDGNGRSGRMLWYWMMVGNPKADLGFLHAFYYQTLEESR